jgi:hypothetical protein
MTRTTLERLKVTGGLPFAQPGDIFFTRGTDGLGRLIRWAERERGEEDSWANHVGVVISPGWMVPPRDGSEHAMAHVSEALWRIEEHEWWSYHKANQGYAVAVFRPRHLTNEGANAVVANAHTRKGDKYAWWRLPVFLVKKLSLGMIPAEKILFLKDRNICSTHMGLAEAAGDIDFEKDPKELDPDYAMDYCIQHPEKFQFAGWAVVPGMKPLPLALSVAAA